MAPAESCRTFPHLRAASEPKRAPGAIIGDDSSVISSAASLVLAVRERDATLALCKLRAISAGARPDQRAQSDTARNMTRTRLQKLHDSACALYALFSDEYVIWGSRALHMLTPGEARALLRAGTLAACDDWSTNNAMAVATAAAATSRLTGGESGASGFDGSAPSSPAAETTPPPPLPPAFSDSVLSGETAPKISHAMRLLWGACALSILVDELTKLLRELHATGATASPMPTVVFSRAVALVDTLAHGKSIVRVPLGVSNLYANRCVERTRTLASHVKGACLLVEMLQHCDAL